MARKRKVGALTAALLLSAGAIATAATIQEGDLRITVLSLIQPYELPRTHTAPIAIFVSGHLATPDGHIPPQLKRLTVKVNRHGQLQSKGLPVCGISQVNPASTERALANCGDALVGSGRFWANIILPDQGAYPTRGRLLVFNGREGGKPALLAHIYTRDPFATSFVIAFRIRHVRHGTYGTQLSASLPQALGSWGYVDRIKLTLRRKYRHKGKQRSYFNAACPAPKGFERTVFPLAEVSFGFAGKRELKATVTKSCAVKE